MNDFFMKKEQESLKVFDLKITNDMYKNNKFSF